jgi:hypothetical protein
MAMHPIPIPGAPLDDVVCVEYGDRVIIFFEADATYTYTQTPSPAFSPQLPYGTFFEGDVLGPFTAEYLTSTTVISYTAGVSKGTITINVQPACP